MKRTKLVLGMTVAALLLVFTSGVAHAQYDTPSTTTPDDSTIPEVTVVRGETVDVSGANCAAGSDVVVTLDDGTNLGTFTADSDGNFVTTITVPAGTSIGSHLVTATCGDVQQFLRVNVLGEQISQGSSGGALARTGSSNTAPLVGIGAGALVLGAAFVYGSRRPRQA